MAVVLAVGLLLVILSCALNANWNPLVVLVFYLLSPLPNLVASRLSGNDLMLSNEGGYVEAGYFITSLFVVSGIAYPVILLRGGVINTQSMLLSVFGGVIVYGSMTVYSVIFGRDQDTF